MGRIEDLEKIEDLKNKGILTQEEFDIEKKKILEQDNKDNIDNPTKTLKNKLKSKKILFILITLGVTILITIIVLIIAFNKKVENEDNADNEDDTKMNINPIATMEIENYGTIKIELYPEQAPNTVKNFIALANNGFYDGLTFHRTIPDFIIQGGDPSGDGTGNARLEDIGLNSDEKYTIPGEFAVNGYTNNTLKHKRGVISMARADYISFSDSLTDESYNSASCQFFIMVEDYASLDGLYAPFGMVIEGMEIVDKIANVEVETREAQEDDQELRKDRPVTLPVIKKIRVETYGINYGMPNTLKYFDFNEWYYSNIYNAEYNQSNNDSNQNETAENNNNISNNQNNGNNQNNESKLDPETTHLIAFSEGHELNGYIEDLENWGIKYKVIKEENLDYDNNVVTNIEPNYCYVDKNTTVTLTVSDNTYNMDVIVDVNYLLQLAEVDINKDKYVYDNETGEYVTNKVKLLLKINGNTIFDGQIEPEDILNAKPIGKIKGKPTDTYKVEATIENVKIIKEINYYARCSKTVQRFEIYAGGDVGAG